MISYKLSSNGIMCDKICKDIHNYLQKYKNDNKELLLVITVRNITHDDTSLIPKLEHKNI